MNLKQIPLLLFLTSPACAEQNEKEYAWLDDLRLSVANSVTDSAKWFDAFFATQNASAENQAWGEARLRLGWEPRSRDLAEFDSRLRIRVKLPNLKNQVDLVLSDYDDIDPQSQVQAARNDAFNVNEDRFNLAIRWRAKPDSGWSHRIGAGRRFQYYYRARYRNNVELSDNNSLRAEVAFSYYNRDKFESAFKASFDHQFQPYSIFRLNNQYYFRDRSNDWLWQHSIQHLYQLKDKSAFVSGFYWEGLSRPNFHLQEYLFSVRYRQNTLREWLFYEVEPFVLWRKDENFSASWGVALRIEGYFGH